MKQLWVVFVLVSFIGYAAPLEEQESFLSSQTFMPLQTAKQRWKEKPFNASKFKTGNPKERASMAAAIITSKKLLGKTPEEVRTLLGGFSGFFWSDYIPAYLIEEGWTQKKDTWQLVFLLDDQGRVNDVRIHKNCCAEGKTPERLHR
jgi:hypothetical protein